MNVKEQEAVERLLSIAAAMSAWLDDELYEHDHGNPNVSMNEPCDACIVKGLSDEAEAAIKALYPLIPRAIEDHADAGEGR